MEVLREGYKIPLSSAPPLSSSPAFSQAYDPNSIKGRALEAELRALLLKGAVEPAGQSLGFFARMFVVPKTSGGWRPIIDLSALNKHVKTTVFKMDTVQTVLLAVRQGDWMCSIDLKDAYLQVPVHPDSRKLLRFSSPQGVFQFKTLCFGLATAPQVFTRVMAPVAKILHQWGVRLLRYLDDWLILTESEDRCREARQLVIRICAELGIQVNLTKSKPAPTQRIEYLGMLLDSVSLRASPSVKRRTTLLRLVAEFLSSEQQPARTWRILLGHLASLTQLVPGGRLRTRALQIAMRRQWDFQDDAAILRWDLDCKRDLLWWREADLVGGTPLTSPHPDLSFWSDASDHGWGAFLGSQGVSGQWSEQEKSLSINWRELRAIHLGLQHFSGEVTGRAVAIFCDNTTAVAYLRNQGGTLSESLNEETQQILRWAEERKVSLVPQFILGKENVVADSLSRGSQVIGTEWSLSPEVFQELRKKWPVSVDLFATSLNHKCQVFFAPFQDPLAAGTDAFLQSWEGLQAYAFPPFSLVRKVLNKARASPSLELTLIAPFWPQKEWFPDLVE